MSLQVWYTDNDNDFVLASERVRVATVELNMQAAECAVGDSQIVIDDPEGTFYTPGLRPLYLIETEAEDDEFLGIIGVFWTWNRVVRRGPYRTGPAREVVITCKDLNTLLSLRVQKGTDAEREEEDDVDRVDWLINTAEVIGGFGDDGFTIEETEFFFTDTPVTMSETDYTGNDSSGVLNDAMQDSSKNAYLYNRAEPGTPIRVAIWYGATDRTDFTSLHSISNDLADIDPDTLNYFVENPPDLETGYTFGPSVDAELDRDPSRQITGAMVQYDGGYAYESAPEPGLMTHRDMVFNGELVKNATQASQRANAYVQRLNTEDDAITCAVIVPAKLVNGFHQGMRVPVRFTHMDLEGYAGDPVNMRIAERTVRQMDAGLYEIAMDLRAETPPGPSAPVLGPVGCPDGTPGWAAQDFYPIGVHVPPNGNAGITPLPGAIQYFRAGIAPIFTPSTTHINSWHFPTYQSGGPGTVDAAGRNAGNELRIVVPGPGTITLTAHTTGTTGAAWLLMHLEDFIEITDDSGTGIPTSVTVPDDGFCYHILRVNSFDGSSGGFFFEGAHWEPDIA